MIYVLTAAIGYVIGSFPSGVVLTRKKFGIDVREMGSGNIGATNVTRVFGWYAGVLVFVFDFAKGAAPVYFAHRYFGEDPWVPAILAIFLVAGHCFSFVLKGRGGKGVATSLGCLVIVAPYAAACGAAVYALLLALTRISAIGSLGGLSAVLLYFFFRPQTSPIHVAIISISVIVVMRHASNIKRLLAGSSKISSD